MKSKYYIDSKKYRIKISESYVRVNGWYFDESGKPAEYLAEVNGKPAEVHLKRVSRPDVAQRFARRHPNIDCGFRVKVYTKPQEHIDKFMLYAVSGQTKTKLVSLNGAQIQKITDNRTVSYNIDAVRIDKEKIKILGWATTCDEQGTVSFALFDEQNKEVDYHYTSVLREDVYDLGLIEIGDSMCGFTVEFPYQEDKQYQFILQDSLHKIVIPLDPPKVRKKQKFEARKGFLRQSLQFINFNSLVKVLKYIGKNGFKGLKTYIVTRVNSVGRLYRDWFEEHKITEEELEEQRQTVLAYQPKFSIVVPTYNTPIKFLKEMVDSVREQTYPNWELCIGDGSQGNAELERTMQEYAEMDSRIKFKVLEKNLGIAGNTNGALELATGDYIGLLDHDDVLPPHALFEVAKALNEDDYDVLYTDEDKVSADLKVHDDPNFKPDFSIDLLCSHNYITHFFLVRKSIVDQIHGFRSEFDGSQDYDFIFRCTELAKKIKHIPKVLYHWRIHGNSVAGDPASKMYAYEAGKHAIEEHFHRVGVEATVEHTGMWGLYHVIYSTKDNPLVSIVIPNKDHIDDLNKCVQSIYKKSKYRNFEFIVVENNSTEPETFAYYEKMQKKHANFKVVTWEKGFNYSAINNFGVQYASGNYLLFLNNDTEIISETAISELLGCCMRDDVGIVGAKLYFGDDTIQHAGVVVGLSGFAGHVFTGYSKNNYGFMMRARINGNYSAVTAACMMVDRKAFEQVGGFSEDFVVALNDIDFCLKVRELGLLVVFNAFSEWHHYESKSRGYEDTEEKIARFQGEIERFQKKWADILEKGDPYYNPNFGYYQWPFTLKE